MFRNTPFEFRTQKAVDRPNTKSPPRQRSSQLLHLHLPVGDLGDFSTTYPSLILDVATTVEVVRVDRLLLRPLSPSEHTVAMVNLASFTLGLGLAMLSAFVLTWKGWSWPWQQRSETVLDRLHRSSILSARPICEISGVAGMSVGVLHRGEVIFKDSFGLRAAGGGPAPDSTTMYGIGSLTKAFTAVAITNLLEDHPNITLDTPVDHILPDYTPSDERLRNQVSLGDFLSHRSGLLGDMSFAVQGRLECLLPKDQLLPTVSRLKTIAPIRRQWSYNNWGYGIAGAVIEKLSGKSFATYLKESILDPLGLEHTTSQPDFGPDDNFADAHIALCDATPLLVDRAYFFKDTFFEPAGGLYSNVDDMLTWAKAVLQAGRSSSSGDPLRNIPTVISNQVPLDLLSHEFRFYGMGWVRTQLPGTVGLQGKNPNFFPIEDLPVLGADTSPMMVYYHQGSTPGYYSALLLFPETESAIVVLTNSIPLNDAADWISQAYASALFHFPGPADYVALAKESRRRKVEGIDSIRAKFDAIRQDHSDEGPRLPLSSYWGIYENEAGNFFIDISEHRDSNETSLLLRLQGKESQTYELRHLRGDTFEWALTCSESAHQGRVPILDSKYFEVHFDVKLGAENPESLRWAGIANVTEGIWMTRRGGTKAG